MKRRSALASETPPPITPAEAARRAEPVIDGRLLLASDFDGTLARPTLDPWRSTIVPRARRALQGLAAQPDVHVALISGRTVADLAARTSIGGASYHGDHGAEWALAPQRFGLAELRIEREATTAEVVALAQRLASEVPGVVDEPWLVLEDKGPALTFHFRAAPDVDDARARVSAAVDAIDSGGLLVRSGGRRSLELRPPGAATKGDTLRRLILQQAPDAVLMLGDDGHDARAFDALRAARAEGRIAGLAIAVMSPAAEPHDVAAHADLLLSSADAAAEFLAIVHSLRARQRRARQPS